MRFELKNVKLTHSRLARIRSDRFFEMRNMNYRSDVICNIQFTCFKRCFDIFLLEGDVSVRVTKNNQSTGFNLGHEVLPFMQIDWYFDENARSAGNLQI